MAYDCCGSLVALEGNTNYKQCNFENISACRRNCKENSSGDSWCELNLQLCVVACHWWYV